MKCKACGNPRARDHRDEGVEGLLFVIGAGCMLPGIFAKEPHMGIIGLLIITFGVWLLQHKSTTKYCHARPEWGETCLEAKNLPRPEQDKYFRDIKQARGQARYNQRSAWEKRGEDPGWDRFKEEYTNYRRPTPR